MELRTKHGDTIYCDGDLTFVKQVADIADISKVNTSYSFQFSIPRIAHNQRVLDMLGLIGSQSKAPYIENKVSVWDGYPIVTDAILQISETTPEKYKAKIKAGSIDFYSKVKDGKLGEDVDLSMYNHEQKKSNIEGDRLWKYFIAYYGTYLLDELDNGKTTNIPAGGLIPYMKITDAIVLIFSHYGWKVSVPDDLNQNQWISIGRGYGLGDPVNRVLTSADPSGLTNLVVHSGGDINFENIEVPIEGFTEWISSHEIEIKQSGDYILNYSFDARDPIVAPSGFDVFPQRNGISIGPASIGGNIQGVQIHLSQGDVITFHGSFDYGQGGAPKVRDGFVNIIKAIHADINFNEEFKKWKVKEFIQEFMVRNSLTAFFDLQSKTVEMLTFHNRTTADFVDWSEYLVSIDSEKYTYQKYESNNYLKQKYDVDGDSYDDGNIEVDNENLESENDIFKSKVYAPENDQQPVFQTYDGSHTRYYQVPFLKMYDISTDADGNDSIDDLKDRFFVVSEGQEVPKIGYNNATLEGLHVADIRKNSYREIAEIRYKELTELLNPTKVFTAKFDLPEHIFQGFDMKHVVYLRQQAGYFLINKLTHKSGRWITAEIVKINDYKHKGMPEMSILELPDFDFEEL